MKLRVIDWGHRNECEDSTTGNEASNPTIIESLSLIQELNH
ncbi:rCG26414 [Rattus norvegicus]|uniref:RCG26414 n=1 Tax=Rattus norvegicus TaxID=10116 RepID=A6HMR3_RAT|nr:rCG26414 [Rattus norvegicus]